MNEPKPTNSIGQTVIANNNSFIISKNIYKFPRGPAARPNLQQPRIKRRLPIIHFTTIAQQSIFWYNICAKRPKAVQQVVKQTQLPIKLTSPAMMCTYNRSRTRLTQNQIIKSLNKQLNQLNWLPSANQQTIATKTVATKYHLR